jgi:ComEC/Rec2-related protein
LWRSPYIWLAGFLIAATSAAFALRRSPQTGFALALAAMLPLGAFYLQARDAAQVTVAENLQPFATGESSVDVVAHVIREGLIRDSPYGGKQESVDVESEQLRLGEGQLSTAVGIRLTIYSKRTEEDEAHDAGVESPLRVYTYGERLRFPAKLRMPRNYRNPGAMDLAGYLSSQGIRLTGSARASNVEVLPGFVGSRIGLWRSAARRSALAHIMQLWPGERGALMQAALIGGRAFFGRDIKTDFQRTGTYHILVVSGINVGILAFAVFWLLRKLPFGETWATILTILLSWGYAFVADLGSPIVRATITLNIYLLTRLLFRDRAGLNALGIAALGILLVNPRTLFEASFQLTFVSVIAVAGIAVPILRRTLYPAQSAIRNIDSPEYDVTLPTRAAEFRVEMRLLRNALQEIIGQRCDLPGGSHGWLYFACLAVAVRLHRHPAGAGSAHGLVFPSRHHHGFARQCIDDSHCLGAVAERGAGCRSLLPVTLAGLRSRGDRRILAGYSHRDRPPHRAPANLRGTRTCANPDRLAGCGADSSVWRCCWRGGASWRRLESPDCLLRH